ncbi:hypothetical protein MBLNU457_g0487t1 [Dothideomycetes sp. NU457]
MQNAFADNTNDNLNRLSQKPGVQSTLILSRDTGAIVQSSGLESSEDTANPASALPPSNNTPNGHTGGLRTAEDIARLVYNYVKTSEDMAREMNGTPDDQLKLLRLRTKKNEIVIVPDAKYIAVVIHNTPPA